VAAQSVAITPAYCPDVFSAINQSRPSRNSCAVAVVALLPITMNPGVAISFNRTPDMAGVVVTPLPQVTTGGPKAWAASGVGGLGV
jgi:hypothetical protein